MLYFLCVLFNHSMCVIVIISHSSPELLSPETETVEYTCNKKLIPAFVCVFQTPASGIT